VRTPNLKMQIQTKYRQVAFMLGYLHEHCRANQTQNSNLKQYIAWGLWDWQPILYSVWL